MPRKTGAGQLLSRPRQPASMRPRPDAAENWEEGCEGAGELIASMRPRPDAAENWKRRMATAGED